MKKFAVICLLSLLSPAANAWIWQNLNRDSPAPLSGEAVHERDLIGKVVLIYCYSDKGCDVARLLRAQKLFETNDRAKFAVVGACPDKACDEAFLRKHKISYPIYEGWRVPHYNNKPVNAMYVLDDFGRMVWQSRDAASQRDLEKALAGAIAKIGQPPSLTEGVSFTHYRALEDQLAYGKDLSKIEARLSKDSAARLKPSAKPEAMSKAIEAQQILTAVGRGMEQMAGCIRTLMDIDARRAYRFLDLHLKSFPRDREKYAKLHDELEKRAK